MNDNTAMTLPAHAVIGPSAAKRWFLCPASVALCKDLPPQPTSKAASDGTKLHEELEAELRKRREEGIEEMYVPSTVVHRLADYVQEHCGEVATEQRIMLGQLLDADDPLACYGTADIIGLSRDKKTLIVMDAKFGKIDVPADDPQLICYAAGAYKRMQQLGLNVERVGVHVMQPFGLGEKWKQKTWSAKEFDAICDNVKSRINRVVHYLRLKKEGESIADGLLPSGKACQYCPGKAVCTRYIDPESTDMPAYTPKADEFTQADTSAPVQQEASLPLAAMSMGQLERHYREALEAMKKAEAVITVFKARLAKEEAPGFELALMRRGAQRWKKGILPSDVSLLTGLPEADVSETVLLSVAALRKKGVNTDLSAFLDVGADVMTIREKEQG